MATQLYVAPSERAAEYRTCSWRCWSRSSESAKPKCKPRASGRQSKVTSSRWWGINGKHTVPIQSPVFAGRPTRSGEVNNWHGRAVRMPECGQPTRVIGQEESEQLEVEPARYFVLVTKREKRTCTCGMGETNSWSVRPTVDLTRL